MQENTKANIITPKPAIGGLLTRQAVAARLAVCGHSVARYTKKGLLPAIRINCRVVRYDPAAVEEFINKAAVS